MAKEIAKDASADFDLVDVTSQVPLPDHSYFALSGE